MVQITTYQALRDTASGLTYTYTNATATTFGTAFSFPFQGATATGTSVKIPVYDRANNGWRDPAAIAADCARAGTVIELFGNITPPG